MKFPIVICKRSTWDQFHQDLAYQKEFIEKLVEGGKYMTGRIKEVSHAASYMAKWLIANLIAGGRGVGKTPRSLTHKQVEDAGNFILNAVVKEVDEPKEGDVPPPEDLSVTLEVRVRPPVDTLDAVVKAREEQLGE